MTSEWPTMSLREAGVELTDCEHKTPAAQDKGHPYVTIPQMKAGRIDFNGARLISDEDLATWTRRAVPQEDDVIVSRRCNPGETAVVPPGTTFALGQNLVLLRADGQTVDPKFLRWLCLSPAWHEQAQKYMNVGAVFDSLKCADIPKFELPIPPLPEQRAIAEVLGSLDDKIELNRRMNRTLESMARAWFKSWFVDFDPVHANAAGEPTLPTDLARLFPAAFESSELGEIPVGWEVKTVGDAFELTMGQSPPGSTYNEEGDGIPFYQGRRDFGFRFPTRRVYCNAPTRFAEVHDVLVSVRAPVGDVNVANERCCIGRGVAAVRSKVGASSYALHAMLSLGERFARFDNEGTVFGSINKKDFAGLPYVMPPREVIDAFEQLTAPLDARVAGNEAESRTLAALRDALLPKLLSGSVQAVNGGSLNGNGHSAA